MTYESLFGGSFVQVDPDLAVTDPERALVQQMNALPDVKLPSKSPKTMFDLCWERFHFLKDLSIAATGQGDLPSRLTPQHAPRVQAIHFGGDLIHMLSGGVNTFDESRRGTVAIPNEYFDWFPVEFYNTAWAGLTAVPFFIDAGLAGAVLNMKPPSVKLLADLRLRFPRIAVILGAAFEVTPDSGWWSAEEMEFAHQQQERTYEVMHTFGVVKRDDVYDIFRPKMLTDFLQSGGRIRGVLLNGDGYGFLQDHVSWIVETAGQEFVGYVNGRLSESRLRPLVYNLAGITAWGKWSTPAPPTGFPTNLDELQSAANTGKFRRALRHAGNLGIRVIDVESIRKDSAAAMARANAEPTGRTVRPHMRCGHYRGVRIATRDEDGEIVGNVRGVHGEDWHYEARPILPTLVNAETIDEIDTLTVYRIPDRKAFQENTDWDLPEED